MDSGWIKKQDPDPGSGSGMNNQDHICESLEIISWVKIPKFFNADPLSLIRDGKNLDRDPRWKTFGSGINIPDPEHCPKETFLSRGACLEDREKPKQVKNKKIKK
jgi:hypothetical protein